MLGISSRFEEGENMRTIVLEGQGGRLILEIQERADAQGFVAYQMLIELDSVVGATFSRTQVSGMRLKELERLVLYVRAHVGPDTQHAIEPSEVFMPLECGFQLQCLSGDQEYWNDGYFVMVWMLYGGAPDRNPDVYVGCSLRVLVSDALAWCVSLEQFSKQLLEEPPAPRLA
jgi:hypothetical protein